MNGVNVSCTSGSTLPEETWLLVVTMALVALGWFFFSRAQHSEIKWPLRLQYAQVGPDLSTMPLL